MTQISNHAYFTFTIFSSNDVGQTAKLNIEPQRKEICKVERLKSLHV